MRSLKTIIAATSAGFLLLSSCGEKKQNSRSHSESGDAGKVSVIATHLPEGVDVQSVTVDPVANRASLVEAFGSAIPSSPPVGIITVDRKAGVDKNSNDVITVQINGLHYTFLVSAFEQFPSTVSVFNSGSATVAPALWLGDSGGESWSCRNGICFLIGLGEKICGQAVTTFCQFDENTGLIISKVFNTVCGPSGWFKDAKVCEDERDRKRRHEQSAEPGELKGPMSPTGATGASPVPGSAPAGNPPMALPEKGGDDPNCTCQCSIRQTVGAEPDCFWASLTGSGATGGCKKTGQCSQSDQFSLNPENTPPPPSTPNGGSDSSDSSDGCECSVVGQTKSVPPSSLCAWGQKTVTFKEDTPTCQKPKLGTWCACPDSNSAATSGGDNSATTASAPPPASSGVCERCGNFCCVDKVVSDTDQCGKIGDPNVSSPTLGRTFTCGPRGGDVTGGGGLGAPNEPVLMKTPNAPATL